MRSAAQGGRHAPWVLAVLAGRRVLSTSRGYPGHMASALGAQAEACLGAKASPGCACHGGMARAGASQQSAPGSWSQAIFLLRCSWGLQEGL